MGVTTLLDHWRKSLQACGAAARLDSGRMWSSSKIFRFLLGFYGEDALWIEYPRRPALAPPPMLLCEVQPRPPKSPERIRMLLAKVAEAVAEGTRT